MKLRCPRCQQKLTIADKYAGKGVRCPACNKPFTVPTPKSSTEALADKMDLDLEGLAGMEQQSSEMDAKDRKTAEKAIKEKAAGPKVDPKMRTCPTCQKETLSHDPYVEILCSHCWNPIPPKVRAVSDQDVAHRMASRATEGFYAQIGESITYPIPALGSILTAAGVAFAAGIIPVATLASLSNVMDQSNYGGFYDEKSVSLSTQSLILMGTFALEVFFFSAVAIHGFFDVVRTTSIGTDKPPSITWSPGQWGKSFAGFVLLAVYLLGMTALALWLSVEGGVMVVFENRSIGSLMQIGGKGFLALMLLVTIGIPMNLLGMSLGNIMQAVSPIRVLTSIGKTHVHYLFLVMLVAMYGIFFGGAFWTIVHDWFVPQIEKMAAGSKEGDFVKVSLGLLAWGVVMSLYFYGAYVMGRLHGLFAQSFRKSLKFGTL